ncbi:MAG: S9 family peptidase [Ilumatobacter sp.]|nr:S9 family peptidase [Ilumatobacter sp.]
MANPIPIELLVAGRDLTEPKLSPDGEFVAFVQRWRSATAIVLVPVAGGPERLLTAGPDPTPGRGMGGGCFDWYPDGTGVAYCAGGELWFQPLAGTAAQLTALGREVRAPACAPDGSFVVFAVDEAEIWKLPLTGDSGATEPARLDDGADAFCFDPAVAPCSSTVVWQAWSPPAMPWDAAHVVTAAVATGELDRWRPADAAVQQPRFMPDGTGACVHDASGWLNVYVGDDPLLAEPSEHAGPTWGMGQRSFTPSPDGRHVAFCRNEAGFGRLCVVEVATGGVTDVGRGGHGQLTWLGNDLVALRTGAVTPTQVVRYDMSALDDSPGAKPPRTVLAVGPPFGWSGHDLPEPQLIEADAGGVTLHARRYAAGDGRMLCWVHGGPTDQWQADFRPRISYWWSRGWDVLVVDPRGTTGHGRDYQRALNGQWGRLDVDDTAVLLAHAHTQGWSRPESTAIVGGSSGGLTVLGVLADHPDLVACGVASYPVADLASLADVTHRFEAHYTDTLVGASSFEELSPIHRAARITAPLLLFHGTDDEVVPIAQSESVAAAIRAAGGSVELVVYDGEGHGFRDPVNVRDEYDRTERFLAGSVTPWQ